MLSLKSKNSFGRDKNKVDWSQVRSAKVTLVLVLLYFCVLMLLCWFAGHNPSVPPAPFEVFAADRSNSSDSSVGVRLASAPVAEAAPATGAGAKLESQSDIVEAACQLIYQGKFDTAAELIKQTYEDEPNELRPPVAEQLLEIIDKYQALSQQRQSARQTAYQSAIDELAELEKLQAAVPQGPPSADTSDVNNIVAVSDANDANDITKVLSTIAKASEFASEAQRAELLSKPFVKLTFQKVIDKAAAFELQGKWLEAYTSCYAWLQVIDPQNEAYSDYAEELLDKAAIVASFQDSPCETRQERFQGIKKEMFIRAINALNVYYVNDIDYSQMASEAIRRCELLVEVMRTSFPQDLLAESPENSFLPPDANELIAFSAALTTLLDEVESTVSEPTRFDKDKFIEVFERVLALNTVTVQLPREALIAQFAEAALAALDPYTVMVWPKQVQDFEKMMTNEFTGIGIEISKPKGLLTVASLLPGTPAYKAGLDAGDVIVAVDGLETKDMSLMCAVHKITGPKGTKVTLTVKRPGEENSRDITITRAKITVPTIRGWQRTGTGKWLYMIDQANKIGYVRLTSFSADTPSALEKVLDQLEQEGLKGLILDLRFNSGGLLESAVDVADKFLEKDLIVRTQPGFGRTPAYKPAHKKGTHPNYPLVVLINSSSASGAEIVAGALADKVHQRAVLVGERTHGKGSVQGITLYPGGGAELKYTMAYYHLPSGQRVKSRQAVEKQGRTDWGVGPDVEIELTSDELKKMLTVQRDNDVLVQADRGEGRASPEKHTIEETLASDPQLAVGILIIKTKLIQAQNLR
ncbi:MAG: S41 family peptidase [Sedimentisphaerales bacterium]